MSKWRPDKWRNPHGGISYTGDKPRSTDYDRDIGKFDAFEAGADAMLEALRKQGIHVTESPWSFYRRNEANEYQFIGEDRPGVIVIIPDEAK